MLNLLIFFGFFLAGLNDLLRPFNLHGLPLEQIWMLLFTAYCGSIMLSFSSLSRSILIVMMLNLAISFISGTINDTIGDFSAKTVYMFIMPVLVFSCGAALRARRGADFELRMLRMFRLLFFVLLVQGLIYVIFAASGMIHRVGNSIPFIVPIIYLVIYVSPKYLFLAPLAVVFSGKRITLIVIMILGGVAGLRNKKTALKYSLPIAVLIAVGIAAMFEELSIYLSRWDVDLLFADQFGMDLLDKFSSGRIGQWMGGIATIDNTYKFFFGSGSGTSITYLNFGSEDIPNETNWYVHNAFITYFVQSGLLGMLLLLGLLGRIFWKGNRAEGTSFSYYYFLLCIVTVPFSANIVVNPLFWFFSGALYQAGSETARYARGQTAVPAAIPGDMRAIGR